MAEPGFWSNQEQAQEVIGRLKGLQAVLKPLEEALRGAEDLEALVEMAQEDPSVADEVAQEIDRLGRLVEQLELRALLGGPLDANSALVTIHARDGGIWPGPKNRATKPNCSIARTMKRRASTAPPSPCVVPWPTGI